jgi:hypothetical protein
MGLAMSLDDASMSGDVQVRLHDREPDLDWSR